VYSLGLRVLALGTLTLIFAGCSTSSGVPSNANAPASNAVVRLNNGPCPASDLQFQPGSNGIWTVAVGSNCVMIVPLDSACSESSSPGEIYTMSFTGGGDHGTLRQSGNRWTFHRNEAGEVDLNLEQKETLYPRCHPTFSSYGTITFTTP
jgi:hypothetical protein